MPLSNYDRAFGGNSGAAREAYLAMVKTYGKKKGRSVFYATARTRLKRLMGGKK